MRRLYQLIPVAMALVLSACSDENPAPVDRSAEIDAALNAEEEAAIAGKAALCGCDAETMEWDVAVSCDMTDYSEPLDKCIRPIANAHPNAVLSFITCRVELYQAHLTCMTACPVSVADFAACAEALSQGLGACSQTFQADHSDVAVAMNAAAADCP